MTANFLPALTIYIYIIYIYKYIIKIHNFILFYFCNNFAPEQKQVELQSSENYILYIIHQFVCF